MGTLTNAFSVRFRANKRVLERFYIAQEVNAGSRARLSIHGVTSLVLCSCQHAVAVGKYHGTVRNIVFQCSACSCEGTRWLLSFAAPRMPGPNAPVADSAPEASELTGPRAPAPAAADVHAHLVRLRHARGRGRSSSNSRVHIMNCVPEHVSA